MSLFCGVSKFSLSPLVAIQTLGELNRVANSLLNLRPSANFAGPMIQFA